MDPTQTKQPKFRRRAEARPDEVLDAALTLFGARGFAHTTVEAVARQAGLSKAAVYLYFPSKRALLVGLVRRAVSPVADLALGQIADYRGDPRPLIAGVMGLLVQRMTDPTVFAVPGLILREAAVAPDMVQIYREEVLDRVLPAMCGLIAQGVAGGFIRAVDPELTVRSVVGPVLVHVLLAQVFGIVPEGGLQLDRLVANHLSILFAGLEPEEAA
ncbi:MAG: TetR/AcrR family transcriptional regulator [bacterium]